MKSWLMAFAAVPLAVIGSVWAGAPASSDYDQAHPYYAEFCAVTQMRSLDGSAEGGKGGHGTLFLKGACRDTAQGYPRLKVCEPGAVDLSSPEAGVSISVDAAFRNANWVALDGRELLLTGGLAEGEPLDASARERVVQRVIAEGYFDGIEFHPEELEGKPSGMDPREYVIREAVSTDFAMSFGRNVYCVKLPLRPEMLPAMVEYLNSRNDEYRSADYEWSGISNNCTHTAHNALGAAGVWRAYGTEEFFLRQLFNLAVPSNEFIDIAELGNDASLEDVVSFYLDGHKRRMLIDHDWIGTQPGVLVEALDVHAQNSLYRTDSDFLILDLPLLHPRKNAFERMITEPRYLDARANLDFFREKYRKALERKVSVEELRRKNRDAFGRVIRPELETEEFRAFHAKFYRHIEKAYADVLAR